MTKTQPSGDSGELPTPPAGDAVCNNSECTWGGKLADCVMCGAVGPLCPECHETVEPCGPAAAMPTVGAPVATVKEVCGCGPNDVGISWHGGFVQVGAKLYTTAQSAGSMALSDEHIDYINRYYSRCRDCADEAGVCPSSGLPCDGSKKAIQAVLGALAYGVNMNYVPPPIGAQACEHIHHSVGRFNGPWRAVCHKCGHEPSNTQPAPTGATKE